MKKALALAATLAITPLSWAETLSIPMEFEFVAIDGKEIKTSIFSHKDEIDMAPGLRKIAVRYKDLIPEDVGDNHRKVSSSPFVISLQVEAGTDYRLEPSKQIRSESEAVEYAKAPSVNITTESGKTASYEVLHTDAVEAGIVNQLMAFGSDKQQPSAEQVAVDATGGSNAAAPAAVAAAPAAAAAAAPSSSAFSTPAKAAPADGSPQADDMLKFWWEQADEQTRKAFMSWAIQNM